MNNLSDTKLEGHVYAYGCLYCCMLQYAVTTCTLQVSFVEPLAIKLLSMQLVKRVI